MLEKSKLLFTLTTFSNRTQAPVKWENAPFAGFGEWKLAAEIFACGYKNIWEGNIMDQEIFAFHVISAYVIFYRAENFHIILEGTC